MSFPSLEALIEAGRRAAGRFPAVLVVATVAAISGMIGVDGGDEDFWLRLTGTAALAIPLFISIDLVSERRRWSLGRRAVLWVVGAGLLAGFMAMWFDWSEPVAAGRYLQLSAAFHLLVAVGPYLGFRELNGFWQYNRWMLFRAISAVVFAAVLFAGLAVALLALDNLFGMSIEGETYARLWFLIAFVFATWFFLAGVPDDLGRLERDQSYDRVLKVFAQYILVPLVGVYLVILTLYLLKVLITQEWPSGWIGWLVSSVAGAGIFSILLVHPIAERPENRWMRTYTRVFYLGILPPIVMLWLAIGQRIGQYGITERRYFLTVLSIWLAGVAIYYAVTRSRDIRIIPATLCLTALLTFTGPWGAYSVSQRSQLGRLETLLERNGILVDGTVRTGSASVPQEDRREISATVRYLVRTHGVEGLVPWLGDRLVESDTTEDGLGPSPGRNVEGRAETIAGLLGVEYVGPWAPSEEGRFTHFVDWDREPLDITGFDLSLQVNNLVRDSVSVADGVMLSYDSAATALILEIPDQESMQLSLEPVIDRAEEMQRASGQRGLDPETMRLGWASETVSLTVFVSRVSGLRSDSGLRLTDLDLRLLFSRTP